MTMTRRAGQAHQTKAQVRSGSGCFPWSEFDKAEQKKGRKKDRDFRGGRGQVLFPAVTLFFITTVLQNSHSVWWSGDFLVAFSILSLGLVWYRYGADAARPSRALGIA